MSKQISLNFTLYETIEKFPELKETLYNLGYLGVKNVLMLQTHGRVMSLINGVEKLGIDKNRLIAELKKQGFEIID